MAEVVIVDAVRTPIGKRNGSLSTVHPADLLGVALKGLISRSQIDPVLVEQVVGGCVSQVGEQSFNITRTAWLSAGLPQSTAATTVDTQCGSSQQATNFATALISGYSSDIVSLNSDITSYQVSISQLSDSISETPAARVGRQHRSSHVSSDCARRR